VVPRVEGQPERPAVGHQLVVDDQRTTAVVERPLAVPEVRVRAGPGRLQQHSFVPGHGRWNHFHAPLCNALVILILQIQMDGGGVIDIGGTRVIHFTNRVA
jgi:hypothetical protein